MPVSPEETEKPKDLSDSDYIKILIDSNYKESINTWTRTGYLIAFNSVLFGFYVTYSKDAPANLGKPESLAFCTVGIIVGLLNLLLAIVSVHYNQVWHDSLIKFIDAKANTFGPSSNWVKFKTHFKDHENLPVKGLHASKIVMAIAIVILLIWFYALHIYVDRNGGFVAVMSHLFGIIKGETESWIKILSEANLNSPTDYSWYSL